jgi:hypothetical protein
MDPDNITIEPEANEEEAKNTIRSHMKQVRSDLPEVSAAIEQDGQTLEDALEFGLDNLAKYLLAKAQGFGDVGANSDADCEE